MNLHKIKYSVFSLAIFFSLLNSCQRPSEGSRRAGEHIKNTVVASVETTPTPHTKKEDSADDPAIWINHSDPMHSVIFGTDKKGGLASYDLSGNQLHYYPVGKINNCDLRYGFPVGNDTIDILAATNRSTHSISLYKISEGGVLDSIHSRTIISDMTEDVYGMCMYFSPVDSSYYVFINSTAGEVEQWKLLASGDRVDAQLVRSFKIATQTEGMVADDRAGVLYVGEEDAGIHKFDAEPNGNTEGVMIAMSSEENKNIKYDIEGLAIYPTDSVNGYLLASAQGNYSYAVFERQGNNRYLGSFRIVDGNIDGVEETDGIDVTNISLGDAFPKGMLVVQDGYNYEGKKLISQNYKYISWEAIVKFFD